MEKLSPQIQPPDEATIVDAARRHHLSLRESEVEYIKAAIDDSIESFALLDRLSDSDGSSRYGRRGSGRVSSGSDDPYNAFVTKCEIPGADSGLLDGFEAGLKDNVAVAGVRMTCGSTMLDGYVPDSDATVVTRLLDAGATITGKLNMSSMAYSAVDVTATGPVLNPHDPERGTGGSSSGSAVAVATGEVDVALGGDQGGSIRIPAAWCGCVGLKPTRGLVPYTGIQSLEDTLDHVGPLASSVADCARTLQAIAGPDPDDPRQRGLDAETDGYVDALSDASGPWRVGILAEGFDASGSDERICAAVREAATEFESVGVETTECSLPEHDHGFTIWNAIQAEGVAAKFRNDGASMFARGAHDAQFTEEFGKSLRARADSLPLSVKTVLVLGEHLSDAYQHRYYSRAQNLARDLARAYDGLLSEVDVLALPTAPTLPPTPYDPDSDRGDVTEPIQPGDPVLGNNVPFNVTGHPAVSVPCGRVDGVPVGLQLVGRRFDERTLLAVAHSFEREVFEL